MRTRVMHCLKRDSSVCSCFFLAFPIFKTNTASTASRTSSTAQVKAETMRESSGERDCAKELDLFLLIILGIHVTTLDSVSEWLPSAQAALCRYRHTT